LSLEGEKTKSLRDRLLTGKNELSEKTEVIIIRGGKSREANVRSVTTYIRKRQKKQLS